MCRTLKELLERRDNGQGKILFVNIADRSYNASMHAGVSYEEAMDTIHVIQKDGSIITGTATGHSLAVPS